MKGGDLSGFKRISWEEAYTEIAQKMEEIKGVYGAGAYHKIHAAGDFSGWTYYGLNKLLVLHNEGYTAHWGTYSVPAVAYIASMIEGGSHYIPMANTRQDVLNADHLVLWAYNPMEAIYDTNTAWYLTQCKEKNIPITVIDTRYSKTASTLGGDFINIAPTTDSALILAMIYHILKNHADKVDVDFINKYLYGFFDNGNTLYRTDVDASAYAVPDGGSLSAFIMGDENDLLTGSGSLLAGQNNALSIYPDTIGYNVNDDDVPHGKTVHIWGQKAKTPARAEKITGIPAKKIEELAELYLNNKVTTHTGLGYQRHTESEQTVWLMRVLSVITKNFGAEGQSFGQVNAALQGAPSPSPADMYVANKVMISGIYDESRTTSPTYMPPAEKYKIPAFAVPGRL